MKSKHKLRTGNIVKYSAKHKLSIIVALALICITVGTVIATPAIKRNLNPKRPTNNNISPAPYTPQIAPISIPTLTEILNLINAQRATAGLANLNESTLLDKAAGNRVDDMVAKNYFNNTTVSPWDFLKQVGYQYSVASTGISLGNKTSDSVVNAFMNDSQTKNDILSNKYDSIGIGIKQGYSLGGYVVTIYLAHPATQSSPVSQSLPVYIPNFIYTPMPIAITPPTYFPSATCSLTKSTYTSNYQSAVQSENTRFNNLAAQISYALGYLSTHGAGASSAYEQVIAEEAQNNSQHQSTLNSLSNTYQQEIASLNC